MGNKTFHDCAERDLMSGQFVVHVMFVFLLDVVFIGKDDHSSGITRLHQASDDLVKLSVCWLTRNLHRLSDTHPT